MQKISTEGVRRRDTTEFGKVIHWEMCRKFQFDHPNKSYMHNAAPIQEDDLHKLLWDFNIHTDHLIPARRPDLMIINKKMRICKIVDFAETKIQRSIFQGDVQSPLLFKIAMIPLNHILRKYTAGYKLSRSPEKINHQMYMDVIKLFAKNEKDLETLIHTVRIYS